MDKVELTKAAIENWKRNGATVEMRKYIFANEWEALCDLALKGLESARPEVEYIEIGHLMKNEYGFVSAHAPDLGALPVGKTVVYMRSPRGTKP